MTYLLDVNVLIALAWPRHVHHLTATQWFLDAHHQGWATTPATESGFIRVSSNPRVFPDGASPGQAAAMLSQFHDIAGHEFWVDATELSDFVVPLTEFVHGSASVTDAHLALITRLRNGTLATFDTEAARLARNLGAKSVLIGS